MRKWFVLASYFMASFSNGMAFATLIPIPGKAMSYYSINSAELTLYGLLYSFTSLLLAPSSSWLVSKSFYISLHTVWGLMLIGSWIRVVALRNFWISLTGQFIISLPNMLMLCSCSNMASIWFPTSQIVLATSIATAANFIGMGFTFIFMPYFKDVELMMWVQAVTITASFILNMFSIRKDKKVNKTIGYKDGLRLGLKDKYLVVMTICSGSGLAVSYSIIGILGLLLDDFGYNDIEIGWMGFIYLLSGFFGGLLATYLTEVKHSTKIPLQYFLIFSQLISLVFAGIVKFYYYSFIAAAIYGAAMTGLLPLSIRGCIEYMNNIDESIPTNMIYFFGQLFAAIYSYPIQYSQEFIGFSGLWIAGILILISFTAYFIALRKSNEINVNDTENYSMQKFKEMN